MGTVEAEVSSLTNKELAERLRSLGENVGPITGSTRSLYEKRLKKRLILQNAATCTISYNLPQNDSDLDNTSQKHQETVKEEKVCDDGLANSKGPFYGVQLPPNVPSTGCHIFIKQEDALKLIKEHPGSRFKMFRTRTEAELFSRDVDDPSTKPCKNSPKTEPSRPVPNEGSLFKAPRLQDLTILRKTIESSDLDTVKSLIWSNPRYLIGSGDNPTVLQEGSRYNALHVCARSNQAEIAKLILDTIENPEFMKLMYPDDSEESRWSRINNLSDMYINTPDKLSNETPLHFACKFGHLEVVSLLTKHPKITMNVTNGQKETPRDVVCSRMTKPSADLKGKMYRMLESQCYVPLLRSDDNTCPAKVVQPWCPSELATELKDQFCPVPSLNKTASMANQSMNSPKDAPMSVRAYAGPMSPSEAKQFHKKWMMSPGGLSPKDFSRYAHIRRSDINKGLERIGRELANEMHVPWSEYWDFLNTSVNLQTEEGLQKLEEHLHCQKNAIMAEFCQKREKELEIKKNSEICDMFDQLNLSESDRLLSNKRDRQNHKSNHLQISSFATEKTNRAMDHEFKSNSSQVVNGFQAGEFLHNSNKAELDVGKDEDDEWERASNNSFYTAADDLDLEYSECSDILDETWVKSPEPARIFMMGEEPCKTDLDVLRAIEKTVIDHDKYSLLHQWKTDVLSYPEDVRNRWTKFHHKPQLHSTPVRGSSSKQHCRSFNEFEGYLTSPDDSGSSSASSSSSVIENRSICRNLFYRGQLQATP